MWRDEQFNGYKTETKSLLIYSWKKSHRLIVGVEFEQEDSELQEEERQEGNVRDWHLQNFIRGFWEPVCEK